MPYIYLSPSTQESNLYINDINSEEYYMNLIADALEPYLISSGIRFNRNTKDMTARTSIEESNMDNYDLHLALHSNAASGERSGLVRGSDVFYYPTSTNGKRFADIVVYNLKAIYPLPDLVKAVPTTTIGEVSLTKAPAVLIEFAFHDNEDDANWIRDNIGLIARNVALSLTQYFDIPFIEPGPIKHGTVETRFGGLNLREKPSFNAKIITSIPSGSRVLIYGTYKDWYVVGYEGAVGYARRNFIDVK